jgi:MFS family permease
MSSLPPASPGRTTLGATTTTIASVLPVFLLGGLAVQVGAELGFSPAGLGGAVAVYFGVSALTSVPAGALVERYGAAVTARAAIVLSAASLLAIAAAGSYPVLVAVLAGGAAANGLGQLSSNAALTRVPAGRQALSFGIKQSAIPVATLLAGASVPAVALTLGWRWAFGLAAVAALGALALVPPDGGRRTAQAGSGPSAGTGAVATTTTTTTTAAGTAPATVPPETAPATVPPETAPATVPPETAPAGRPRRGSGRDQATGALVVVGLAVALGAAAAGSLGTFLVDSAVARGLAPGTAGLTLTLGSVACIAARIGGGWLADRRGTHGDVATVAVLMAVGAVGLALLAVDGSLPLAVGVLLGFGFGWAFPGLVNVAVVQLHPHAPAAATSITQTGVYAGGCVGPLTFGAVAAGPGYPTAWLGAAGAMLLAAGLILLGRLLLHRHLRDRPAPAGFPSGRP